MNSDATTACSYFVLRVFDESRSCMLQMMIVYEDPKILSEVKNVEHKWHGTIYENWKKSN